MDSVWNHATKRNNSVPDDVLEAMWIRHLTLDRDNPERALEGHLAMMYDVNLDHDYGTGVVDDTRAKSVVEREKELWQKGQEYFEQGWRLCFGERHVIGIPCEVPVDALSWVVVSAGHIATTEAHRLTYVIKR